MLRRFSPIPVLALLTAAASEPPAFRPDLFFAGRTRGAGTVRVAASSRPKVLTVEGVGRMDSQGGLELDQAVTLDGKTTQRTFRIARAADGSWQGTLTDAAGPVRATVEGARMTLDYRMRRAGMRMHQTLDLQPGGRTLRNRARVTLMGLQVAVIDETITKLED